MRSRLALYLLALLCGLSGCVNEGRVRFRFVLEDGLSVSGDRPLFLHLRVLDSGGNTLSGIVSALDDPGALRLDVPYGEQRVATLEIRDGQDVTGSKVLFYGLSEPFTYQRGDTVTADIPVVAAPIVQGVSTAVASDFDPQLVQTTTVPLSLQIEANALRRVVIAQDPSLTFGRREQALNPSPDGQYEVLYSLNLGCAPDCIDGVRPLFIRAEDNAGYVSETFSTILTLDQRPPSVVAGSVALRYIRPPAVLFELDAAGLNSTVRVSFALTEPVVGTPTVTFARSELPFSLVEQVESNWTFERVISSEDVEGPDGLLLTATDLAGNRQTSMIEVEDLRIDRTPPPPAAVESPDAITYIRQPWGSSEDRSASKFSVLGAPGAVAPQQRVLIYDRPQVQVNGQAIATLVGQGRSEADGSFAFDLAPLGLTRVFIIVADDAGNLSSETATAQPVLDVEWTAMAAPPGAATTPPITASQLGRLPDSLALNLSDSQSFAALSDANLHDPNAPGPVLSHSPRWSEHIPGSRPAPEARAFAARAFDGARGQSLFFSGANQITQDTWVFDGTHFEAQPFNGQEPRCDNGSISGQESAGYLAYVGAANSTLLVCRTLDPVQPPPLPKGSVDQMRIHTFDRSWSTPSNQPATGPQGRVGHRVVWDAQRGRLVLFGGNLGSNLVAGEADTVRSDTWELSVQAGASGALDFQWEEITSAGAPGARDRHTMVYDSARQQTLLFGGVGTPTTSATRAILDDLWRYDGSSWQQLPRSAPWPSPRHSASAVFHAPQGALYLVGGYGAQVRGDERTDAWRWDADGWTQLGLQDGVAPIGAGAWVTSQDGEVTIVAADGRTFVVLGDRILAKTPSAQFPERLFSEIALFYPPWGRMILLSRGDVWSWSKAGWVLEIPFDTGPRMSGDATAAFDPVRAQLIYLQKRSAAIATEVWRLDDRQWVDVTPQPLSNVPSLPFNGRPYFKFDARFGKLLLHATGALGRVDTYLWDGADWELYPTIEDDTTNSDASTAVYDTRRMQHLLVELELIQGGQQGWTWRTFDEQWGPQVVLPNPGWGEELEMVYDAARGHPLLFSSATSERAMLWEFDGQDFVPRPTIGLAPPRRLQNSLSFDPRHKEIIAKPINSLDVESSNGTVYTLDVDPLARPGLRFEVNLAAADVAQIQSIELSVDAGGFGYPPEDSVGVQGAELLAWDAYLSRWRSLATGSSPTEQPSALSAVLLAETERFILPAPPRLNFVVSPPFGMGRGHTAPQIRVDDLKVTVRYRLPAP